MIKIKEVSKTNLRRALNGKKLHLTSQIGLARDSRIRNAMSMITHQDPQERWSIEHFLSEIAEPEGDPVFELVDRGKF